MDETVKQRYYNLPRQEMLPYVPSTAKRVLEVGCAGGAFAKLVKERTGAIVWGIEMNAEAAAVAAQHIDRVFVKDAFLAFEEIGDQKFDCIVFNDVLEHLVDPYRLLAVAKQHLAPGGVVVASIPNIRHHSVLLELLLKGDFDYADYGILDRTHLRFFTKRSIEKMFKNLGFEVEISGLPPTPTPTRADRVASVILPKRFQDVRFIQFACVAHPTT